MGEIASAEPAEECSLSSTEIASLRTELVRYSDHVLEMVKFATTATSALIGLGLTREGPTSGLIVLLPLLILAPSVAVVTNRRQNIVRIATYLRAFGGNEFQYETRLFELRRQRLVPWKSYHLSTLRMFLIPGFICIGLSAILLREHGPWELLPAIVGILWGGSWIMSNRAARQILMGGQFDHMLYEAWRRSSAADTTDAAEPGRRADGETAAHRQQR